MAAEIVENGVDSAEQEEGQKEIKVWACYSLMKYFYPFFIFFVLENFIILFLGGTNCG